MKIPICLDKFSFDCIIPVPNIDDHITINFEFNAGEDVDEKLKTFCELESMPILLYNSLSYCVYQLIYMELDILNNTLFSTPSILSNRKNPPSYTRQLPVETMDSYRYYSLLFSEHFKKIIDLESGHNEEIIKDFEEMDQNLKMLEDRQLKEVTDKWKSSNDEKKKKLLDEHAKQRAEVDESWTKAIVEKKATQKKKFTDTVQLLFNQTSTRNNSSDPTLIENNFSLISGLSERPISVTTSLANPPSAFSRYSVTRKLSFSYSNNKEDSKDEPKEESKIERQSILYLSNRSFVISLLRSSVNDFVNDKSQREYTAKRIFSEKLIGVVLPVECPFFCDELKPGVSERIKKIANLCERINDYHFPSLSSQIEEAEGSSQEHKSGDCIITHHSNLANAHLLFHIYVKYIQLYSQSQKKVLSDVYNTVKQLISFCDENGVGELVIPVIFDLPRYFNETVHNNIIDLYRAIYASLETISNSISYSKCLKEITLLVPDIDERLVENSASSFSSIF